MSNWRPNTIQWLAIAGGAVVGGLSLAAGMYAIGCLILAAAGALVWYLDPRGRKPENAPVRSARCKHCGHVGEPHWARCAKCGVADWKT